MNQIVYKGANLSLAPEIPIPPAAPPNGQIYLNQGDFVPYFKFDLLTEGAAESYETESYLSRNPAAKYNIESGDDQFVIENGKRRGVRNFPVSGTPLGQFQNPDTLNVRVRAKKGNLAGAWSSVFTVVYQY